MENRKPQLLPGFRFQPTDEELVVHYLKPKIQSLPLPNYPITEADVCGSDPWNLLGDSEEERYFFSTVETKYPNGKRINRTAPSGHWKPTSLDKQVVDSQNKHVGTKKTFVFHRSKSANGSKIDWLMHEYKLANPIQVRILLKLNWDLLKKMKILKTRFQILCRVCKTG
ncbi:putative transcription factor NAM family [Helianthus debilis subsp. tardiflorus]